jgi:hypothetical protein
VAALPAGVPLAVEAPCRATTDLPAVERARRAYRTLSALLETDRSAQASGRPPANPQAD